jgi:hypothetical protein
MAIAGVVPWALAGRAMLELPPAQRRKPARTGFGDLPPEIQQLVFLYHFESAHTREAFMKSVCFVCKRFLGIVTWMDPMLLFHEMRRGLFLAERALCEQVARSVWAEITARKPSPLKLTQFVQYRPEDMLDFVRELVYALPAADLLAESTPGFVTARIAAKLLSPTEILDCPEGTPVDLSQVQCPLYRALWEVLEGGQYYPPERFFSGEPHLLPASDAQLVLSRESGSHWGFPPELEFHGSADLDVKALLQVGERCDEAADGLVRKLLDYAAPIGTVPDRRSAIWGGYVAVYVLLARVAADLSPDTRARLCEAFYCVHDDGGALAAVVKAYCHAQTVVERLSARDIARAVLEPDLEPPSAACELLCTLLAHHPKVLRGRVHCAHLSPADVRHLVQTENYDAFGVLLRGLGEATPSNHEDVFVALARFSRDHVRWHPRARPSACTFTSCELAPSDGGGGDDSLGDVLRRTHGHLARVCGRGILPPSDPLCVLPGFPYPRLCASERSKLWNSWAEHLPEEVARDLVLRYLMPCNRFEPHICALVRVPLDAMTQVHETFARQFFQCLLQKPGKSARGDWREMYDEEDVVRICQILFGPDAESALGRGMPQLKDSLRNDDTWVLSINLALFLGRYPCALAPVSALDKIKYAYYCEAGTPALARLARGLARLFQWPAYGSFSSDYWTAGNLIDHLEMRNLVDLLFALVRLVSPEALQWLKNSLHSRRHRATLAGEDFQFAFRCSDPAFWTTFVFDGPIWVETGAPSEVCTERVAELYVQHFREIGDAHADVNVLFLDVVRRALYAPAWPTFVELVFLRLLQLEEANVCAVAAHVARELRAPADAAHWAPRLRELGAGAMSNVRKNLQFLAAESDVARELLHVCNELGAAPPRAKRRRTWPET